MDKKNIKIDLVGDVLTGPFSKLASKLPEFSVDMTHHDIDQHFQVLMSDAKSAVLICHARADFFYCGSSNTEAEERAFAYCHAVKSFSERNKVCVILNTISPSFGRIVGMAHIDHLRSVAMINEAIFQCAKENALVAVADIASVVSRVGYDRSINIQNAMVMRMPYTGHVIPSIVDEYARILRERFLPRKKALILDADNTLWGGIVGEDGIEGITIDTQFPGVVYRTFQNQLLELRASGVLLTLVSKNNEQDVREAFEKIDMPLKWEHFAAIRVNWLPKSENIVSIANELNIGVDSFVFIDDNLFELNEVGHALPAVDRHQFDGGKPAEALSLLNKIKDLSAWSITEEDANKATQYVEEAQRKSLLQASVSLDDYLQSLGIKMEVGINRTTQIKRISQLTNKTNQFNLTTRRYSEADIIAMMEKHKIYDFRIIDRYGDMGLIGLIIVVDGEIDTFLMSCRALGRQVEVAMLKYVCGMYSETPLRASYMPTQKNAMVSHFFESNGFEVVSSDTSIKRYRCAKGPQTNFSIEIMKVEQ
ncbi:HAD-IIIC family phosphatase [Undibacterium sp. Ji67W]|uniref:HAD-IIIC family phosphatase n=1 Tax=Undibacterium sp. Ji67W TaxID=3413042 RepID=UPI003BEF879E